MGNFINREVVVYNGLIKALRREVINQDEV